MKVNSKKITRDVGQVLKYEYFKDAQKVIFQESDNTTIITCIN